MPNPVSNGSATFELGFTANYFGLYWGSVDGYNSISFYDGANLISTYTGTDLFGAFANGNQVSPNSNRYVNFQFTGGELFNKIVMTSSQFAFESDNHAYATVSVPEPASAMLMLLGLAGVRARRRMQKA